MLNRQRQKRDRSQMLINECGVTIVELLVVIFIMGFFLSFFLPRISSRVSTQARVTATRQEMEQLRKAIVGNPDLIVGGEYADVGFKGDLGRLPRHLVELATRRPDTTSFSYPNKESLPIWNPWTKHGWKGPYMRDDGQYGYMKDAWGEFYIYSISSTGDTIGLVSPGADGEWYIPGTPADDIQILF